MRCIRPYSTPLRFLTFGIIGAIVISMAASGCTTAVQTPPDDGGPTTLASTAQVQITALPTPASGEQAPEDSAASPAALPTPTPQTVQPPPTVAPAPTASESGGGNAAPTETPALPTATPGNVPSEPSPTRIPPTPAPTTVLPTPSPVPPPTGHNVGNSAPDFTVTTVDGVTRSLTDYKQTNQPVVVYFFATW